MPLWDFRAHATWQTCLSSYVFTFLADTWKSHSAGGCIHRCRRLSRGCKATWEDSARFWQRRKVVRALRKDSAVSALRGWYGTSRFGTGDFRQRKIPDLAPAGGIKKLFLAGRSASGGFHIDADGSWCSPAERSRKPDAED